MNKEIYEIVWPKCLKKINPIKLTHERMSQARAHVYHWCDLNNCSIICEDKDPALDGYDVAIKFKEHFQTELAIVAINNININIER